MEFTNTDKRNFSLSVVVFITGILTMILSSVVWMSFTGVYKSMPEYNITYGDLIATSGQTAGQMFMCLSAIIISKILRNFVPVMQALFVCAWFLFYLGVYDLIDIFLLNPFEVSVPKFLGFVLAVIVTIIRMSWITNK